MIPGLHQRYTSVSREGACYLDTELDMAGLQISSYAQQSDPAQTCLRFPLPCPPQAKRVFGLSIQAHTPGPAFP